MFAPAIFKETFWRQIQAWGYHELYRNRGLATAYENIMLTCMLSCNLLQPLALD
jgi:hypothetical protein